MGAVMSGSVVSAKERLKNDNVRLCGKIAPISEVNEVLLDNIRILLGYCSQMKVVTGVPPVVDEILESYRN